MHSEPILLDRKSGTKAGKLRYREAFDATELTFNARFCSEGSPPLPTPQTLTPTSNSTHSYSRVHRHDYDSTIGPRNSKLPRWRGTRKSTHAYHASLLRPPNDLTPVIEALRNPHTSYGNVEQDCTIPYLFSHPQRSIKQTTSVLRQGKTFHCFLTRHPLRPPG